MSSSLSRLIRTALKRKVPKTEEFSTEPPLIEHLPTEQPATEIVNDAPSADYVAISADFDRSFYLDRHPDVAESGMDPVLHYLTHGWQERRDPRSDFSTSYYLDSHPDVARAGVNPFLHYILAGRSEGRAVQHPLGQKANVLAVLETISDRLQSWKRLDAPPALLGAGEIRDALAAGMDGLPAGLILAVAHDDYSQISGGTQAAIRTEEAAALQDGFAYFAIWPWQALPCLSVESDPLVCLRLNGHFFGTARISAVVAAAAESRVDPAQAHVIVHSLLGHEPKLIGALAGAFGLSKGWYWLHDYFGICPCYNLQRNDLSYCGVPPPNSAACGVCVYGTERTSHLDRLRGLFETLAMTIVAPSEASLAIWSKAADLATPAAVVHPHATPDFTAYPEGQGTDPMGIDQPDTIRFAFLGATLAHKGWNDYLQLAQAFRDTPGREFHYFGHYANVPDPIVRTHVEVTGDTPDAMLNAVRVAGIDVFINWPAWPETFSFTTYEALGAGAIVLTNQVSGNVAAAVRMTGRGRVFETFDQLMAFVNGPGLTRLVHDTRAVRAAERGSLRRSRLTLDLIAPRGFGA